MTWTLVTSSWHVVDGWRAEAARLRGQLDAIQDCVEAEYSEPFTWRSEQMTAEQWHDIAAIEAKMLDERLRDDFGNLMPGGSASGVVQGYRGEHSELMIAGSWSVGGDGCQINTIYNFSDYDMHEGDARKLYEHSPEWLVKLLGAAAGSVNASEARIVSGALDDELADAREEAAWHVGVLTLFPGGIGDAELPESITALPCPADYPGGVVLVADLGTAIDDPESLVPDLLRVHDLYLEHTSPSR
jgi:hypothetical protein